MENFINTLIIISNESPLAESLKSFSSVNHAVVIGNTNPPTNSANSPTSTPDLPVCHWPNSESDILLNHKSITTTQKHTTMKTLHTIGAAIMIVLSTSAFADDKKLDSNKTKSTEKTIKVPEFVWGNPEDAVSIDNPAASAFKLPSFVWGDPSEVVENMPSLPANRITLPGFVWGDPSEVVENMPSLPANRITLPGFVWGDPSTEPEILTTVKLPEFVWGNPEDID